MNHWRCCSSHTQLERFEVEGRFADDDGAIGRAATPADGGAAVDWRRNLRHKIAWLLVAKLLGLLALWGLFFSPYHRVEVTPERTERLLALEGEER